MVDFGKSIFTQTQRERDEELSLYSGRDVKEIEKLIIGTPKSIMLFKDEDINRDSFDFIYKDLKFVDIVDTLRTLSCYIVERRAKYIQTLENKYAIEGKKVLDFGCGVGSHGIYCSQQNGYVDFFDIDGPLYSYAKWRVGQRKLKNVRLLSDKRNIIKNCYDVVLCLDVLEHVANPTEELIGISEYMKKDGVLVLEVSTMIKPTSGHFTQSIENWKKSGMKVLKDRFVAIDRILWRKK